MRKFRFIALSFVTFLLAACGQSVVAVPTPVPVGADISLGTSGDLNKIARNLNSHYSGTDVGADFTKELDTINWEDDGAEMERIENSLN